MPLGDYNGYAPHWCLFSYLFFLSLFGQWLITIHNGGLILVKGVSHVHTKNFLNGFSLMFGKWFTIFFFLLLLVRSRGILIFYGLIIGILPLFGL